ncbi:hypothetical protein ACFU53_33600 [Streptomyces sp. NPDC057474]|uniref:hypothetical protein n=1 Tax=Streptomyces sp. NPDC057474 TaxID=3346144 RepID=UPI0036C97B9D
MPSEVSDGLVGLATDYDIPSRQSASALEALARAYSLVLSGPTPLSTSSLDGARARSWSAPDLSAGDGSAVDETVELSYVGNASV